MAGKSASAVPILSRPRRSPGPVSSSGPTARFTGCAVRAGGSRSDGPKPDHRLDFMETSMGMLLRESDGHAERIMLMVESATAEQVNDPVTRSWSRCLNEYRFHPDKPRKPAILENAALESRRERRADVIDCARYEMTTLYQ